MVTPWYFHKVFANEKTYSLNQSLILLLLDHILKKKPVFGISQSH